MTVTTVASQLGLLGMDWVRARRSRRPERLVVATMCAALVLPILWLVLAELAGPSDGTSAPPTAAVRVAGQGSGLRIDRAVASGPLRAGDVVVAVDGVPLADLLRGPA